MINYESAGSFNKFNIYYNDNRSTVLGWFDELREIDRKTRNSLTIHGMVHRRADVDRLYVPWKHGGRGLRETEAAL